VGGTQSHADPASEAVRLLAGAAARDLDLHLVGGVAIAAAANGDPLPIAREFKDVDFVTRRGQAKSVKALMLDCGYAPDEQFNAMNGGRRLLFWDEARRRQVDVFIGRFEMCHRIPVLEQARTGDQTIPLPELLLTKLQIVELNEKDAWDIFHLLSGVPVGRGGSGQDAVLDTDRFARLLGADWGWWRTVTGSLAQLPGLAAEKPQLVPVGAPFDPLAQARQLEEVALQAPKGVKWKLRANVGDRVRWYEVPEEVDH
jgi:hypothetical protein